MSLAQLPVEAFEVLFSFLTQEHHGRLYSTGNLTIRRRVLTTPRTCSRSPFSEGDDFAMDIMLATASTVRTNGLFINRIVDMDTKPVNIRSLTKCANANPHSKFFRETCSNRPLLCNDEEFENEETGNETASDSSESGCTTECGECSLCLAHAWR
jgi:hypothetical protein